MWSVQDSGTQQEELFLKLISPVIPRTTNRHRKNYPARRQNWKSVDVLRTVGYSSIRWYRPSSLNRINGIRWYRPSSQNRINGIRWYRPSSLNIINGALVAPVRTVVRRIIKTYLHGKIIIYTFTKKVDI